MNPGTSSISKRFTSNVHSSVSIFGSLQRRLVGRWASPAAAVFVRAARTLTGQLGIDPPLLERVKQ